MICLAGLFHLQDCNMPFLRMHTTYIQAQMYILLATMLTIETMFLLTVKFFWLFQTEAYLLQVQSYGAKPTKSVSSTVKQSFPHPQHFVTLKLLLCRI